MSYFFSCKFGGHYKNCSQLFQSIITDSGHCCAFNILPEQILMNRNENIETYWFGVLSQWLNWNPESGYAFPYNSNDLPRRSISPGLFSGLSVTLNLNRTQHFCTSTSAIGLRVIFTSALMACTQGVRLNRVLKACTQIIGTLKKCALRVRSRSALEECVCSMHVLNTCTQGVHSNHAYT